MSLPTTGCSLPAFRAQVQQPYEGTVITCWSYDPILFSRKSANCQVYLEPSHCTWARGLPRHKVHHSVIMF
jgi:hypothetical protein